MRHARLGVIYTWSSRISPVVRPTYQAVGSSLLPTVASRLLLLMMMKYFQVAAVIFNFFTYMILLYRSWYCHYSKT